MDRGHRAGPFEDRPGRRAYHNAALSLYLICVIAPCLVAYALIMARDAFRELWKGRSS